MCIARWITVYGALAYITSRIEWITSSHSTPKVKPETGPLALSSSAFSAQALIPIDYSCAGSNISPPLSWHGAAPAGTTSWAVVMQDLDVKPAPWVQWSVTAIPVTTRSVASGQAPAGSVTNRASNGTAGFVGLCPPQGKTHRYQFTVFAMGKPVSVTAKEKAPTMLQDIQAASVGSATLTGRFSR